MRHDPAAVFAALDSREEEVHIRSDPALERVAVLAEFASPRVRHHVCVGEPCAEDCIAARLWTVVVA